MVSGYYPFDDTSKGAMSSRTFDEAIVAGLRPRVVPECSEPLRELIELCWMHEPEERPSVQVGGPVDVPGWLAGWLALADFAYSPSN